MKRTIGGDRLGSGKKMTVDLKTYNRSTHDLGYIWRSTTAAGTLVPFMVEVALPGDTFDINLNCDVKTHPTIGPLFGSYKVQLDIFQCPVRLYQGQLHNNKLGIGMKMATVKLPQIQMEAADIEPEKGEADNQQINPSAIFSYLGIRGLGKAQDVGQTTVRRQFNAVPYLGYWDIYKNYYANKQEEKGAVIHANLQNLAKNISTVTINNENIPQGKQTTAIKINLENSECKLFATSQTQITENTRKNTFLYVQYTIGNTTINDKIPLSELWNQWIYGTPNNEWTIGTEPLKPREYWILGWDYTENIDIITGPPEITFFDLDNIDTMRENILAATKTTSPFMIDGATLAPYGLPLAKTIDGRYYKMASQEGLALKTYQSDLFNNWMSTEWIDGEDGISAITAIDTSEGSFTIDTLNLSQKVYDMLNRIAISGGSYDDWSETVYSHEGFRKAETPIYHGGLIKELVFQEVVSNAEAVGEGGAQPLGTLAGKGIMGQKHKGGNITVKVDEISYLIGIFSLTPRVDYSQGNKWDVNLENMDDFHKPALDEIGFQDLITDQMHFADTRIDGDNNVYYVSAGKQPAWINYMTNVNQTRGNFAIQDSEMFMTLNRRYEYDPEVIRIRDVTTYIDPVKFNHIFAETARDAQNFWVQIGLDITARRVMSAKVMPNL